MQRRFVIATVCVILVAVLPLLGARDPVPSDPLASCTVPAAEFNKWFAKGNVTANGVVLPANSVDFTPGSVCDFYNWSWQMFLWMNSSTPSGLVVDSDQFFEVSAYNGTNRHFISNLDRGGRMRTFNLFKAQGQKGKGFFIDQQGNIETPEIGQANTNGVLISQNGSLVYYGISTNDVFASFLTGVKTHKIAATQFPSSQVDLDKVTAFAFPLPSTGKFKDAVALVLEVKSSWVEATSVPNASKYITIMGEVPDFDKTDPKKWVPKGSKPLMLAMVGMHVVGTVKGHPEMIWATFEHIDNAPNDTFTYTNANNQSTEVTFDSSAASLFCKANAPRPPDGKNSAVARVAGSTIVSVGGGNIGPSNTIRFNPWGQNSDSPDAMNNTQIISVNNSVRGQLTPDDVRRNYFLLGATWTNSKIPDVDTDVKIVGSQLLANATMETYSNKSNCFSCHAKSPLGNGGGQFSEGLSHIYGDLLPLP